MRIQVLCCGCCGVSEDDVEVLQGEFGSEDLTFSWIRGLCETRRDMEKVLDPETSFVALLAGKNVEARGLILLQLYRTGLYPLNVDAVNVAELCRGGRHIEKLKAYTAAALGAVTDFSPYGPDHLRPTGRLEGMATRRSLLTLMTERYYDALPLLERSLCAGPRHCDLCARACPAGAIRLDPFPSIDPGACTSCGICLAECPLGALTSPALGPERLLRRVAAWAAYDSAGEKLLVLACRGALYRVSPVLKGMDEHVLYVEVTCLRSLKALDLLKVIASSKARVRLIVDPSHCTAINGCDGALPAAHVVEDLLRVSGREGMLRVIRDPTQIAEPSGTLRGDIPAAIASSDSLHEAVGLLMPDVPRVELPGPGAGVTEVDPDRCTFCSVCWQRCPSASLSVEEAESIVLLFNHETCTGCGVCQQVCPEDAVTVHWAVDTELLGRTVRLVEDQVERCTRCGGPIAPSSMLRALGRRVELPEVVRTLCSDCRVHTGGLSG